MRRREEQAAKAMENSTFKGSRFLAKVASVPLVGFSLNKLSDVYTKTKVNTGIFGKMIGMSEAVTMNIAERVKPLAPVAALTKIDDLACNGFEIIETRVPQMKKQPAEIVTDTKDLITVKVAPVVKTFNRASEVVCKTIIAQKTFDVCDYMLGTARKTLDIVLPPSEQEKSEQNGVVESATPVEDAERPYLIAQGVWALCTNFTQRLFYVAHARCEHAAATTDVVIKSAQKAFSRPTNTS